MENIEHLLGKIHNCDCLEFMKQLPDNCVDLVLTSPPYDGLRLYNGYSFDLPYIGPEIVRILKYGAYLVWVVNDSVVNGSETGTSFKQALGFMENGLNLHDTMIYQKNACPFPESNRYNQCWEYMFVFCKGKPKTFNPIKRKNLLSQIKKKSSTRNPDGSMDDMKYGMNKEESIEFNVWKYDVGYMKSAKDDIAFQHPAIFPEQLAKDHIVSWTNEGDIVLDIFGGSGTTGKMAEATKRKWMLCELSDKYCEIANKRIQAERNQLKLF
jgi:site-specific DNA-methyltransferase (adenine-specific)